MSDYYVDATLGAADGDGTLKYPFKTITSALTAIDGLGANVHIHVAKGRYDGGTGEPGSGEAFPIVLRGVSLEGEGAKQTTIVGTGYYEGQSQAGEYQGKVLATVVMGDDARVTSLSGFTLSAGSDTLQAPPYAVFCDRGNAEETKPNTLLTDVTVGPKYNTGIVVTNSTGSPPSGCNLQLSSSTVRDCQTGLRAIGCDDIRSGGNLGEIPVAVELGDRTQAGGNLFTQMMSTDDHTAVGVRVSGCVRSFVAWFNNFFQSDAGIVVRQPRNGRTTANHFEFEYNNFQMVSQFGIKVGGGLVQISDFSHNEIDGVANWAVSPDSPEASVALRLESLDEPELPQLARARSNVFGGSEQAVVIRGNPNYPLKREAVTVNFGTASDPGENIFACNASERTKVSGGDVLVSLPSGEPITLPFFGNFWDHAPPTVNGVSASNGADVTVLAPNLVDIGGAMVAPRMCLQP